MKFTEAQLQSYAAPLSKTEDEKCKNAIGMVRDALKLLDFTDDYKPITKTHDDIMDYSLVMRSAVSNRKVKIFIQGSYANNTNVRTESDVDIAIVQEEVFKPKYRNGVSGSSYGFIDIPLAIVSFKDEVEDCLKRKFDTDVERRNKSIKVYGNSYRKDADTVPCRRFRDYTNDYTFDQSNFVGGVVITPDVGSEIINYPEQHIDNGRKKNSETNHYYKRIVRIMKKMRHIMLDNKITTAKDVSSFGLESLLWNVENHEYLGYSSLGATFEEIMQFLIASSVNWSYYVEANGIKPLFSSDYEKEAYANFMYDLASFYEYDA